MLEIERIDEVRANLNDHIENIDRIINTDFEAITTPEVQAKFADFKEVDYKKIKSKLDHCINVLKSPIYVGLIGRYSHGKTALLNRLFGLAQDTSLPTGAGQVTAKVTRVEFQEGISSMKAIAFRADGSEETVDPDVLRHGVKVGQKAGINTSDVINGYIYHLPIEGDMGKIFNQNNLALIDTPGLGGIYYSDKLMTESYIPYFDLMLLCIRIDEIDQASQELEDYLNKANSVINCPIIPVFTFWDIVSEASDYSIIDPSFGRCDSADEVLRAAKKKVVEKLPALKNVVQDIIGVSIETGFNVSRLRDEILNKVNQPKLLIEKNKPEISSIYMRKLGDAKASLDSVNKYLSNVFEKFFKEIEKMMPESDKHSQLKEDDIPVKRKLDALNKKVKRIVMSNKNDFYQMLQRIDTKESQQEINEFLDELSESMNKKTIKDIYDEAFTEWNALVAMEIQTRFKRILRRTHVSDEEEFELLLQDLHDRYTTQYNGDKIEYSNPSLMKQIISGMKRSFLELLPKVLANPQIYITTGIGIVLIILGKAGGIIPLVGNEIQEFFTVLGILALAGAAFLVYPSYKSVRAAQFRRTKTRIKNKLEDNFNSMELKDEIVEQFKSITRDYIHELNELLDDFSSDWQKDVKRISRIKRGLIEEAKSMSADMDDTRRAIEAESIHS